MLKRCTLGTARGIAGTGCAARGMGRRGGFLSEPLGAADRALSAGRRRRRGGAGHRAEAAGGAGPVVIIDNRPGAGASIGTDLAAKAPPDGYTLLETPGAALTVNPQLMQVAYDPVNDLMPVAC